MVLETWINSDELNVIKWWEQCHTQGRLFHNQRELFITARHHAKHWTYIRSFHLHTALWGGDLRLPLENDKCKIWRSEVLWNFPKVTQLEDWGLEFETKIGFSRGCALNLIPMVSTLQMVPEPAQLSNTGWTKLFRKRIHSVSRNIYYGYSAPGAALGTGDTATNKTEKDSTALEIIFLWVNENMMISAPVHLV